MTKASIREFIAQAVQERQGDTPAPRPKQIPAPEATQRYRNLVNEIASAGEREMERACRRA